jgi:hypothetical protein
MELDWGADKFDYAKIRSIPTGRDPDERRGAHVHD